MTGNYKEKMLFTAALLSIYANNVNFIQIFYYMCDMC